MQISESQFETLALDLLEEISEEALIVIQNKGIEDDCDLDCHDGILSLETPKGTLVVNKHRPSQQIWLSSPICGAKYFNLHKSGRESIEFLEKETNEKLEDFVRKEVGRLIG